MINHARTLLVNIGARSNHITAETAAEYIPHEFAPVKLTNELQLLRRSFFGSRPDARFLNLRARELMSYVHQTEFAHYVYDLDPRVTYWPTTADNFADAARSQIIVTQLSGPAQRLNLVGTFKPNHSVGISMHKYVVYSGIAAPTLPMTAMRLETPDAANTIVAIQELGTTTAPEIYNVGDVGAIETALLPQTDVKLSLNFAEEDLTQYATVSTESADGLLYESYASTGSLLSDQLASLMPITAIETLLAQWLVIIKAVPDPIITTTMPTLELLGEPVFLSLFGVVNKEPYNTFKNLWFDHYSPVYRLAGLTLAMIYRTEELRRAKHA